MSENEYPLAYDNEGNPIDVPEEAAAWRVRRGGGRRGRPRQVFDKETGRQLEIPLESTLDDLIDREFPADRYRLEAVDAQGRVLPNVIAVVEVPESEEEVAAKKQASIANEPIHAHELIARLVEANVQVMTAMASAFGPVAPFQAPAPPPVVLAHPAPPPEPPQPAIQPEQIMVWVERLSKMFLPDGLKIPGPPTAPPADSVAGDGS